MRTTKRLLSILLSAVMLFGAVSVGVVAYAEDSTFEGWVKDLAYAFFDTDIDGEIVYDSETQLPATSLVADATQYTVTNSSEDYQYESDTDETPVRALRYMHRVTALDNSDHDIEKALNTFISIAERKISYTYGDGDYTPALLADDVSEILRLYKVGGEYLFLDGYTYIVDALGNFVTRSTDKTYEVALDPETSSYQPRYFAAEEETGGQTYTDLYDAVHESAQNIRKDIREGNMREVTLFEALNIDEIIHYFVGNCTAVNAGNWFHDYEFRVVTDMDTVLRTEAPTDASVELHDKTVKWHMTRLWDDSRTRAYYVNTYSTGADAAGGIEIEVRPYVVNNDREALTQLAGTFNSYFSSYLADTNAERKGIQSVLSSRTDAQLVQDVYPDLTENYDVFTKYSVAAVKNFFGQDAYEYMSLLTLAKPIRGSIRSDRHVDETYLPEHEYDDVFGWDATYKVTNTRLYSVIDSIDALMKSRRVGEIIQSFINVQSRENANMAFYNRSWDTTAEYLQMLIENFLFSDNIINALMKFIYPMLTNLLDKNLTNSFISSAIHDNVSVGASLLESLAEEVTDADNGGYLAVIYAALATAGVGLTPAGVAWSMHKTGLRDEFPLVYNHLFNAQGGSRYGAGVDQNREVMRLGGIDYYGVGAEGDAWYLNRWKDVDWDQMVWGINGDDEKFGAALTAALSPFAALLACILGENDVVVELGEFGTLDLGAKIQDLPLYNSVLLPLLECLGLGDINALGDITYANKLKTHAEFKQLANTDFSDGTNTKNFIQQGIVNPLLKWVTDVVLVDPISTVCNLLPNISYYLTSTALLNSIKDIEVPLRLRIDGLLIHTDFKVYTLKVADLLKDKLNFLDSLQGVIDLIGVGVDSGVPIVGYMIPLGEDGYTGKVYPTSSSSYNATTMTQPVKGGDAYHFTAEEQYGHTDENPIAWVQSDGTWSVDVNDGHPVLGINAYNEVNYTGKDSLDTGTYSLYQQPVGYVNNADGSVTVSQDSTHTVPVYCYYNVNGTRTVNYPGSNASFTVVKTDVNPYVEMSVAGYMNTAGYVKTSRVSDEDVQNYPAPVYAYYEYEETINAGTPLEDTVTRRTVFLPSGTEDYELVTSVENFRAEAALPPLMEGKLQASGTLAQVSSLRTVSMTTNDGNWASGTRKAIVLNTYIENGQSVGFDTKGLVLLYVFRYLFAALKYRPITGSGTYSTDYTILDALGLNQDMLNRNLFYGLTLGEIIDNIALHPDECIAALYELFQKNESGEIWHVDQTDPKNVAISAGSPYKYKITYPDYYHDTIADAVRRYDDYNYGTAALYSEYWSKEDASYVAENLDELINNVLAMLKLDNEFKIGDTTIRLSDYQGISDLLDALLADVFFNNEMLSTIANAVYTNLDNLGVDLRVILGSGLDIDYSKKAMAYALAYAFRNADGFNIPDDYGENSIVKNLMDEAAAERVDGDDILDEFGNVVMTAAETRKYKENTFYRFEDEYIDEDTGYTVAGRKVAYDWGYDNPAIRRAYDDRAIFLNALSAIFSPFALVIRYIAAGEDLSVLGVVNIPGYEGYAYSWINIMEAFGATRDLISYRDYLTYSYTAIDQTDEYDYDTSKVRDDGTPLDSGDILIRNYNSIFYLLKPMFNWMQDLIQDPLQYLLDVIPNLMFYLSIGAFSDCINNLVHFAYVLLYMLQPVVDLMPLVNKFLANISLGDFDLNLSLPLDIDLNALLNGLISTYLTDELLTFEIENKNIPTGTETVEVQKEVLDDNGDVMLDDQGNVVTVTAQEERTVYQTATLKITLPYIDFTTLCCGELQLDRPSISTSQNYVTINSGNGGDMITLLLRLVLDTLFYKDNNENLTNFMIGFFQLNDEEHNDRFLREIMNALYSWSMEQSIPDKILKGLFTVYKYLVPLSGKLADRFKKVDFSLIDLFSSIDDMPRFISYVTQLLDAGSATTSTDSPTNPSAHTTTVDSSGLSGFAKLIAALKNFFSAIANFFARLFGMA